MPYRCTDVCSNCDRTECLNDIERQREEELRKKEEERKIEEQEGKNKNEECSL